MDSKDEKGVEDKGNSLNINRWNVKLPIFFKTTNILLNSFIWIYLLESNIPNEYPNIFMRRKKFRVNVRIYSLWKIHKYLGEWIYLSINIQTYLNIRIFSTHCTECSKVKSIFLLNYFFLSNFSNLQCSKYSSSREEFRDPSFYFYSMESKECDEKTIKSFESSRVQ